MKKTDTGEQNGVTSYYVFVSTEDDKRLVKGGIGTYLGLLVSVLGEIRPDCEVDWVTQAPGATDFTEEDRNVRRHYLSRVAGGRCRPPAE